MVDGDYDKVIACCKKSLELHPDNASATIMLEEINRRIKSEAARD